jgi:ABC-type uncharacterized transport system permease subunit
LILALAAAMHDRLSVGADARLCSKPISAVDEIVSTLMFNVIALQLFDLLLFNWLRDPTAGFVGTMPFPNRRCCRWRSPARASRG